MITSRTNPISAKMERRASTNSESSIEPMDISTKTTSSTDPNSSLALKSSDPNDSDNFESDRDDEYAKQPQHTNFVRRENPRNYENNLLIMRKKFRLNMPNNRNINNNNNNNNNLQFNYDKIENLTRLHEQQRLMPTTQNIDKIGQDGHRSADSNENLNVSSSPEMTNYNQQNRSNNLTDLRYNCPICGKLSVTQHEFTEHIRSHNNSNNISSDDSQHFTCQICFKVLSSASSLDRHVLVHTGERPFTCKFCHVTFTTNGNMHRHMRTHKQRNEGESYESDGSTDSSVSSSTNNNNFHNHHLMDGKRKIIDEDSGASIKRRLKTINNNNIVNKPLSMVQQHQQSLQQNYASPTLPQFCCPVCVRSDFVDMLSLENHMDREHPSIQARCRYCEVVFKSHKALNAHRCAIHHKSPHITQGFKDLTFVDFSSEKFPLIAKSMCEQTMRTAITNQKFECLKCGRAFPCASAVDIHIKSCGIRAPDSPQDFSIRRRLTSNETTSDEDAKRDDFFAHLDLKNKSTTPAMDAYNACITNSMKLYDRSQMVQIKQERHTPQPPPSNYSDTKDLADIQSILSVTSSGGFLRQLDKSLPPVMPKELPFSREEEEAQDAFTAEFRKMKLRGEFPCKLCSAVFPNLRALKGHNRIHLSAAGSGPYCCNMCPYSIHDKAALIRHMRTHNGDRPYECGICNYAFTTKANCERHLRNRHGKTTREEVKRAIIYHPSEDSSCDDPVKKMQIYNSSYDDDEHASPKDRSTPVSHLKEMLMPDKSLKIQVKSLEQLQQQQPIYDDDLDKELECDVEATNRCPVDLSMDALDLSKTSKLVVEKKEVEEEEDADGDEEDDEDDEEEEEVMGPKIDMAMFEKNQQLLLAQQQFFSETFPKIDPAHYFQLSQLYRNLMFPPAGFPIHPLFLQNSFLPPHSNEMKEHAKEPQLRQPTPTQQASPQPPMFPSGLMMPSMFPATNGPILPPLPPRNVMQEKQMQQQSQSPMSQPLPHSLRQSPHNMQTMTQQQQQHNQMPQQPAKPPAPSSNHSPGPVKMVIKNGVLMPKQKQRRYRTERPFACEHCSARFTLRSNMERHIKQQHPQYWAQRQRSGHNILRRGSGGGGSNAANNSLNQSVPSSSPQQSLPPNVQQLHHMHQQSQQLQQPPHQNLPSAAVQNSLSAISDQVKYAILAQQLKCRNEKSDYFVNPIAQNHNNMIERQAAATIHFQTSADAAGPIKNSAPQPPADDDEDDDSELIIDEDSEPEDLSVVKTPELNEVNVAAKKVAENILEQAMRVNAVANRLQAAKTCSTPPPPVQVQPSFHKSETDAKDFDLKISPNLISKSESIGKYFKDAASLRNEEGDLVSVSKLVDNATNIMSFGSYFRPDVTNLEHSDEEGLVASGSASESNNSGTEDPNPVQNKKKSAYSLAPNRVSCPYCQRMFPWTSSLRRHILTHTGQKPFKCSHCPLLFTTKSNCDRHLLRKHGNIESAVSLYVPLEDIPEPVKETPVPVPKEEVAPPQPPPPKPTATVPPVQLNIPSLKVEPQVQNLNSTDLPFKCHLCDGSFTERIACLEHIKHLHTQDFTLLMAKGAIETDTDHQMAAASAEDDDKQESRGKYPDYANRKVICAFCLRRFWSTEDLRRHMRTHSGERPFQCDVCMRKFTLKHSMLRHQKKHTNTNPICNANSASDLSDDEQPTANNMILSSAAKILKIPDLIPKELSWKLQQEHKELLAIRSAEFLRSLDRDGSGAAGTEDTSGLIGNLLGISDQGILNRVLLSSADEAAKLLGVEK